MGQSESSIMEQAQVRQEQVPSYLAQVPSIVRIIIICMKDICIQVAKYMD